MEIRIVTLPGGKIEIHTDGEGVSAEQGADATLKILALLQAKGINVQQTSGIELHRDGAQHVHEVRSQRGHQHGHTGHSH